jgi:hypothetical protein
VEFELPEPIGVARADPADPRRKRFFFTLKNPDNFLVRKLLKAAAKNSTIGLVPQKVA